MSDIPPPKGGSGPAENSGPSQPVLVSVIIPAHNAAGPLELCLKSVAASDYPRTEVIVVSDASTDGTAEVARRNGVRVMVNDEPCGAAYARNVGASVAAGDILFFVDADVVLNADAISLAAEALSSGEADAVFGSYIAETRVRQFTAQFKNYQHHFHHQVSYDYPVSFWSGCGAVTREVFTKLEGFDVSLQFCEDIEFGHALVEARYRVRLLKDMQAEHLKEYGLRRLVRSELVGRAIPWTRLLRSKRSRMGTLNTNVNGVLSVALAGLVWSLGALAVFNPILGIAALACLVFWSSLNLSFLGFLVRRRGILFALGALPLLFLHYTICGLGYVLGHLARRYPPKRTPAPQYAFKEELKTGRA